MGLSTWLDLGMRRPIHWRQWTYVPPNHIDITPARVSTDAKLTLTLTAEFSDDDAIYDVPVAVTSDSTFGFASTGVLTWNTEYVSYVPMPGPLWTTTFSGRTLLVYVVCDPSATTPQVR